MNHLFNERLASLNHQHASLIRRPNEPELPGNGIFLRYKHPILTDAHTPLFWRYDLDERTNPYLMERWHQRGL